MEDNEPKSQSLQMSAQETEKWAGELSASCKEGSLEPGGQQGRTSPQSSRAEAPTHGAKGDSVAWSSTLVCGAQLSQRWSRKCLRYTLKVVYSTFLGLFDKCFGTPDAKWGISPGAYLWVVPLSRHSCSDHMCKYLRCASLPDASGVT